MTSQPTIAFLGTGRPATAGELVILASGPDEVRDTLAPVFAARS
jgi:3-hydroxyisobutyrate dehydrogenase-like beta-hydroxyacid dehydrogenase